MMTSNELFYGDSEPVWVVDSSPYPLRRGHVSSYDSEKYYGRSPSGYSRGSYGPGRSDYYTDIDGYRGSEYYRPDYYQRGSSDSYYGAAAYNDTYYDSSPQEYYDYRRPSTVVLKVPICCEECAEEARNSLFALRGVRAVYCDVRRERVTVTGTAAPADVLQVLMKLHKRSRFWGDEDYY